MTAQRKDTKLRNVREKAAAANQNAKTVASRVQMTRKNESEFPEMPTTPTKLDSASNVVGSETGKMIIAKFC
jgi:hypothetical protein